MFQSTTSLDTQFSPHASLAALVAHLQARGILDLLRLGVQIGQKTVKDSPQDKLLDMLLALLCGAQSLLQLNTELRADPALQRAAGRTIIRVAGGGGSIGSLNFLLERGYAVVSKDYSVRRTHLLVKRVPQWVPDTQQPDRQVGWVPQQSSEYVRPVRRLAVRSRTAAGRWQYAVLLCAGLTDQDVLTLLGERRQADAASVMRASLHCDDQRGGGIQSSFGQDKSGLGLSKRNKKRFEAQRLLMLLGPLAHNLLIWARRWWAEGSPDHASHWQHYGIKRLIRDLAHISGILTLTGMGGCSASR